MKKVLRIETSVNGSKSYSHKLSDAIIDKLKKTEPGLQVKTLDLTKHPFPHLEEAHLESFFTPKDQHQDKHRIAIRHSDHAIQQINDADIIIIAVPIYNFSIPSTLKSWLDHVVRAGVTFNYTENGPEGLVKGKKVFLAIASGAIFSEGMFKEYEFAEKYLRTILSFIGMSNISVFRLEGTAIPGIKDTAVDKALNTVNEFEFA